ncbi:site-specific recombinase, phage integrase family [Rhodobacteraceae bacterium KLH11]|nr:site-specific recombinase, phage integrase family [Rhodobacteraceae bacterium KLH11]
MFSTRRQEEIARIEWDGLKEATKRILVKDLKHPGQKKGNDVYCDLPDPAFAIADAMPKTDDQIFPYNERTISARFTRACKFLQIVDLHFHDLRHDGVSRLFEMGLTIPQVAAVSAHRSWASLQRYTHLEESGDKYENWEWKDRLTKPLQVEKDVG